MVNGNWMIVVSLALRVFSYTGQYHHRCRHRSKFLLRAQEEELPEMESSTTDSTTSTTNESTMTDRFKFQVNALLGMYDPVGDPTQDTERSTEHPLVGALFQFPTSFTFTVVGRTGDEENRNSYTEAVQAIVRETTGDHDTCTCEMIPRGNQFTKVTCTATVDSAAVITSVHEALGALDATVMKF